MNVKVERVLAIRERDWQVRSTFNTGLAIIVNVISAQFTVNAIDNNARYRFYSPKDIIDEIVRFQPSCICFSIGIVNVLTTYNTIHEIKNCFPEIPIIAGGLHMNHEYREALEHGIDYVVRGEGELVILPLLEQVISMSKSGGDKSAITLQGVSYIHNGQLHDGGIAPLPLYLDRYGEDIDFSLLNFKDFYRNSRDYAAINTIVSQRGCPFKCSFCSDEFLNAKVRYRSVMSVVNEIESKYRKYGINNIVIEDSNFTLHEDRLEAFCNEIIARGLNKNISFSAQSNSFRVISRHLLALMKECGFTTMGMGLERLEQDTQRLIKKKLNPSIVDENIRNLKEFGFNVCVMFIVGFPFDTPDKIDRETALYSRLMEAGVDMVTVNILNPCPGTDEMEHVAKNMRKWYLNPIIYSKKQRPLYQILQRIQYDPRLLSPFSFDPLFIEKMLWVRDYFRKRSLRNKSPFMFLLYLCVLKFAKVSQFLYFRSPKLEQFVFGGIIYWYDLISNRIYQGFAKN